MLYHLLACTRGANAFNHVVYRVHDKTMGQLYMRNSGVVETESLVTVLAIKVYVHVVIVVIAMAVAHAEFVFYIAITVFNGVNEMAFAEKSQTSGYATLIDSDDGLFQFSHRRRMFFGSKCLHNNNTVARWLNAVLFK